MNYQNQRYLVVHADIAIEQSEYRTDRCAGVVCVRVPEQEQRHIVVVQRTYLPDAVTGPLRAHPRHAFVQHHPRRRPAAGELVAPHQIPGYHDKTPEIKEEKKNAINLKRMDDWGNRSSLHRGDTHKSDVSEAVADLYWREREVLDAEARVLVNEGFGWSGPFGALGDRGGGDGYGLEVVPDSIAEDGHVGAAGGRCPRRGESAIGFGAPGRARGGRRGLGDGLT